MDKFSEADEGSPGNTGSLRIKTFYQCLAAPTSDGDAQFLSVVFEDEQEAAAYVKQHPMSRSRRSTGEEYWPVTVFFAANKELEALTAKTGLRPAASVRKEIDTILSDEDVKDLQDIAKMIEVSRYEGMKTVAPRSVRVYNELLKAGYIVDKMSGGTDDPACWNIRW